MKNLRYVIGVIFACDALVLCARPDSRPFYSLRFRPFETDDAKAWQETKSAIAANPGCCDEVWFSTGISYIPLSAHRERAAKQAKAAEDCRAMGIAPSVQVQATLGHGDDIDSGCDFSAMDWGGFTSETGTVCRFCSCPREPKLHDYFEEVGRIYGAYHPACAWIDDDLRIDNHWPAMAWNDSEQIPGCWCPRCVSDFSDREGRTYTRETLRGALRADCALADRWETFGFESISELARRIAVGFHAVSPETRMGYQHCYWRNGKQAMIFHAMNEATGLPTRSRPGGGAWLDHNPYEQLQKAYSISWQKRSLQEEVSIEFFCPEIETCPRTFSCRTPRGVLLECFENLALGQDALSLFVSSAQNEPMEWFGRTIYHALAANRAMLVRYAEVNRGTRPAGLFIRERVVPWTLTTAGVPVVNGVAEARGEYAEFVKRNGGKEIDITEVTAKTVRGWAQLADEISGGRMPAVALDAIQAFVMPRIDENTGALKTLAVVNTTIGRSEPTRFKLRGVPSSVTRVTWWALDAQPCTLSVSHEGADAFVTIPPLDGWNGGYMALWNDLLKREQAAYIRRAEAVVR